MLDLCDQGAMSRNNGNLTFKALPNMMIFNFVHSCVFGSMLCQSNKAYPQLIAQGIYMSSKSEHKVSMPTNVWWICQDTWKKHNNKLHEDKNLTNYYTHHKWEKSTMPPPELIQVWEYSKAMTMNIMILVFWSIIWLILTTNKCFLQHTHSMLS